MKFLNLITKFSGFMLLSETREIFFAKCKLFLSYQNFFNQFKNPYFQSLMFQLTIYAALGKHLKIKNASIILIGKNFSLLMTLKILVYN